MAWSLTALALVLFLCACASTQPKNSEMEETRAPTWQEQYDLGIRYLSEGNYEEAIIAFTAAIEIDPRKAPAYVGRGDAYIGSGETEENLAIALSDYTEALSLDGNDISVYLKIADVYIAQGHPKDAQEILKRADALFGNSDLIESRSAKAGFQDSFTQQHTFVKYVEFESFAHTYQMFLKRIINSFLSNDIDQVYSALLDTETYNALIDEYGSGIFDVRTYVDGYKIQLSDSYYSIQVRPENGTAYAAKASDGDWSIRKHSSGECVNWNWNGSYQWEENTIDNMDGDYWEYHVTGTMVNCLVDGLQYTREVVPSIGLDGSVTSTENEYEREYENGKELRITYVSGYRAGEVSEFDDDGVTSYITGMFGNEGYDDHGLFQEFELWN